MDKVIEPSQIKRERRIRIIKWGSASVIVIFGLVVLFSSISTGIDRRNFTLSTVDSGPLETTIPASGRVVPAHEEIITSPVSTRLLKVYTQAGDSVAAGTPLLLLDLQQEETELAKLIDNRDISRQELEQLRLNNQTMLSDLEMQIEVSSMNLNRLALDVENEHRLDSLGSGTGDRVRQAETAYIAGKLELKQLQTKLENERLRTAAAEKVQQLNINGTDRDIQMKQTQLHQGSIPAPINGVLTYIITDLGAPVHAGDKVAVVSDLSRFKVIGEVPEGNSSRIGVGSRVNVRLGRDELKGTVSNITPQAKQGVINFVVQLDDPGNRRLQSGLSTELYVAYGYKDRVTRLANTSVFKGPGEYSLFVLDGKDKLVKRKVKIGDSNREYVEIISGLKEGDQVVGDMEQYRKNRTLKIKHDPNKKSH